MDRYTTLAAEQIVDQKQPIGWAKLVFDPAGLSGELLLFNRVT